MDLILKIKELDSNVDEIEHLVDDLIESLDGKRKKFNKDYFHLYNLKLFQVNRFRLIHFLLIFFVTH